MYGDGFALGINSHTVSQTVSISSSACSCTDVSRGRSLSLCARTTRILFQGAFLKRSLSFLSRDDKAISNAVVMAQ